MKLTQTQFPTAQYFLEEHPKTQIYLHHTAGNPDPYGVFNWWSSTPDRIATCVTIGGKPKANSSWQDGEIIQGFSSKYWAYHLGLKQDVFTYNGLRYKSLDKISIGIEVCNWGQLSYKDGKYYNHVGGLVPQSEVCELPVAYKGYKFYHNYTDAQIESIKELLLLWKNRYNIPLEYNDDIWDISRRALNGDSGVFTHNSVRKDKIDVYPHPKLITMLKNL